MIRLNYNPIQGSTLSVNLSFRDQQGKYYVPLTVSYSLLALNSDKESWSVVGDYYKKSLTPASLINLVIPNLQQVTGTTLQRKVLVYWKTTLDGEFTDFIDEVSFELKPLPTLSNQPPEPTPSPIYVEITNVEFQNGSPTNAPINPVIKLTTNLPVYFSTESKVEFEKDGIKIDAIAEQDSTKTVITVFPGTLLEYSSSYVLKITGLISNTGSYEMKEPFEYHFTTLPAGSVTLEELQQEIQQMTLQIQSLDTRVTALEG